MLTCGDGYSIPGLWFRIDDYNDDDPGDDDAGDDDAGDDDAGDDDGDDDYDGDDDAMLVILMHKTMILSNINIAMTMMVMRIMTAMML